MRKNNFYRCCREDNEYVAVKTSGYSEGDIGLHEENGFWIATHIPTGMKLTPVDSRNKTNKQALKEAKQRIAESVPDFAELIAKHEQTKI